VLTCTDITHINHGAKLRAENKMITMMNSQFSHEFLTPLKCINMLTDQVKSETPQLSSKCLEYLHSVKIACELLQAQIQGNLDFGLIHNDMFQKNLN
jgi:hypothetical protein